VDIAAEIRPLAGPSLRSMAMNSATGALKNSKLRLYCASRPSASSRANAERAVKLHAVLLAARLVRLPHGFWGRSDIRHRHDADRGRRCALRPCRLSAASGAPGERINLPRTADCRRRRRGRAGDEIGTIWRSTGVLRNQRQAMRDFDGFETSIGHVTRQNLRRSYYHRPEKGEPARRCDLCRIRRAPSSPWTVPKAQ